MNKSTMLLLGLVSVLSMVKGGFGLLKGNVNVYGSGPKGIPHKRSQRYRPHAPNDGHWHMKFHRSR